MALLKVLLQKTSTMRPDLHPPGGATRKKTKGLCTNSWQQAVFSFHQKLIFAASTLPLSIAPAVPSLGITILSPNRATMALAQEGSVGFAIQPQATAPAIDASEWPLLLKDYDKREYDTTGTQTDVRPGNLHWFTYDSAPRIMLISTV